jgi:hypothetical protein
MSLPGHIIVRVNDDEVVTRSQAFDSFQWHIEKGSVFDPHDVRRHWP